MTGSEQVRRWKLFGEKRKWGRDASGTLLYRTEVVAQGPPLAAGESEPVVSLSDLQREIAELRRGTPDHTRYVGWHGALDAVAARLGIDLEEGKD